MAGIGRYTIRPAGARGINLVLPPDCRLVQALIDGVATTATRQGPRNWELATPSSVLPFELVLVFDGALARATSNDEVHLTAPRLPGMRVEQTVWEITTPDQPARLASGEEAVEACSAREAAVRRLEAAARGLDDVANAQGGDVLAPILADAAMHWNGIVARSSRLLAGMEPAAAEADSAISRRVQAAEGLAARARQRLAAFNMPALDDAASDRQAADQDSATSLYLAADNEVSQLKVNAAAAAGNRSLASRLWAVLAISLATIAVPLARWPQVQQWFAAHAHLLLALAGLAWWLFAPLGWLGWLLVLAAIWLSVRFS
jgi:hypothetical protein